MTGALIVMVGAEKGSRWESGAGALLYVRRCGKAIALAEREGAAAVIRMSQKTYRKA